VIQAIWDICANGHSLRFAGEHPRDLPWVDYPRVLAFARRTRADLIAASEWYVEYFGHPARAELLSPEGPHPGLAYEGSVGRDPRYRVHTCRVEPAGTSDEEPQRERDLLCAH